MAPTKEEELKLKKCRNVCLLL
ncbi:hypothetical protein CCACVL1_21327 [Corchorus capsularis]|uniref:Uncharacterized protein n=1 Tax=Corchorus capsularis TaxID=210143 RepID=A0A1R3H6H9_COCAP|nr:hypothetical protein CCACVL1_21327 [Corchorus capsularis]